MGRKNDAVEGEAHEMPRGELEIRVAQTSAMSDQDRFDNLECWLSRPLRYQPSELGPTLSFRYHDAIDLQGLWPQHKCYEVVGERKERLFQISFLGAELMERYEPAVNQVTEYSPEERRFIGISVVDRALRYSS